MTSGMDPVQPKLYTFAEMQGIQSQSTPQNYTAPAADANKGDTVTIMGKEVKKKTVGIAAAITAAVALIGTGIAAVKRGKVINTGKEAGFIDNLKEGVKSIFTSKGRNTYRTTKAAMANAQAPAPAPELKPAPEPKPAPAAPKGDTPPAGKVEPPAGKVEPPAPTTPPPAPAQKPAPEPKPAPAPTPEPKPAPKGDAQPAPAPEPKPAPVVDKHQQEIQAEAQRRTAREAKEAAAVERENAFVAKTYGIYPDGKPIINNHANESARFMQRVEEFDKKISPEIREALGPEFRDYISGTRISLDEVSENSKIFVQEFTPDELKNITSCHRGNVKLASLLDDSAGNVTADDVKELISDLHLIGRGPAISSSVSAAELGSLSARMAKMDKGSAWRFGTDIGGPSALRQKALEQLGPDYISVFDDKTLSCLLMNIGKDQAASAARIAEFGRTFTPDECKKILSRSDAVASLTDWVTEGRQDATVINFFKGIAGKK